MDHRIIEEEKRDEKTLQLELLTDNLSSSSLDIDEVNSYSSINHEFKQELQPIKVLKAPDNKIDFRLTPMYDYL